MLNNRSKWLVRSKFQSNRSSKWDNRAEINMVAIYEKTTNKQAKHTPGGFIAQCPFPDHEDRTPSFVMYQDDQSYYCFGCQKSGSASWFKHEMEKIYGA